MATVEFEQKLPLLEANIAKALTNLKQSLDKPEETVLREHQHSMIQSIYNFLQSGDSAGYLSEPTGVGKSVVMAYLAHVLGLRTVILSPTQQILLQTAQAAKQFFPDSDISNYFTDEKNLSGQIINTTYQSVLRSAQSTDQKIDFNNIELVLCDEAHLGLGEKRHAIYRNFPSAIFIGLTATPYFTPLVGFQERSLVEKEERWTGMFKNCIHEMTLEEAIEREILANLDVFMIRSNTTVMDIKIQSSGEYRQQDLEKFFATESRDALILGMMGGIENLPDNIRLNDAQIDMLSKIHENITGKRTAIFAVSINHANRLVDKLLKRGVSAAAVHSQIDSDERAKILTAYQKGEINVVVGVDMLRIGWDSPETEVGIYARPTASGIVKTQELGRILRRTPNKDRAIAIELVDTITDKRNAQVLLPNIFDPEFVLRGAATGQEPASVKSQAIKRVRPEVTFSGMDIESIVEEARSQEMLRHRFKQSSIKEMCDWFESNLTRITQENPEMGTYWLFQILASELPQKIPGETQQIALQALASLDSNTQALGKKALVFLNARQLLAAVDYYNLSDDPEEKNDLIQEAISVMLEKASKLTRNSIVSLISGVRAGLESYTAQKYDIPRSFVTTSAFKVLIATIEGVLGDGTRRLSTTEVNALASELSQEAGVPESTLKDYLMYKIRRDLIVTTYRADIPEEFAESRGLEENIEDILGSIRPMERRVVGLRFGLLGGSENTLKAIGEKWGKSAEHIRWIEFKALKKLRHPSCRKKLRDYEDPYREPARNPQSLMNGAITAFYQGDLNRVEANLAEIEGIVCNPLSWLEKEIIRSSRSYPYSYKWDSKTISQFINFAVQEKNIIEQDQIKNHIFEAIEKLREVWKLRSKIP